MNDWEWTRQEKFAAAALVIAVVACVLTFVVPEVRQWAGLGPQRSTAPQTSGSEIPKSDVEPSAAQIFDHDPSMTPSLPIDADSLIADGRSYYVVFRPLAYVKGPNEPLLYVTRFVFHDPSNPKRWAAVKMYGDNQNARSATIEMSDHVFDDKYSFRTSLLAGITEKGYKETLKATEFQTTFELLNLTTRPDATEPHAKEFETFLAKIEVSPVIGEQQAPTN